MLLFKRKFLDLIRSGQKTQTIRIWPHRKYRAGQRSYIPGIGYIQILDVDPVELLDLTPQDALLDGFPDLPSLLAEIEQLYPHRLTDGLQVYRLRFRMFSPEEQAIAVKEREEKKRSQCD